MMNTMLSTETVMENRPLGSPSSGLYQLVLKGKIAQTARPGQFVHLQIGRTLEPLLRRPVSIAAINRAQSEITLCYRIAGRGTALLTGVKAGERLSVLGPLGNGFRVEQEGQLLLLAGGIGIFPLLSLLEAVDRSKVHVKLLWGGENREFLENAGLQDLRAKGIDCQVSTLDGSLGYQGLITDLFNSCLLSSSLLDTYPLNTYPQVIQDNEPKKTCEFSCNTVPRKIQAAACGPRGMLEAVTAICLKENIPIQVSLEERMACGVGACLGCVCTVRTASGSLARKRVCKDGPVFDGKEVVWHEQG